MKISFLEKKGIILPNISVKRLLEAWSILNDKEMGRFKKFLKSPFFNPDGRLPELMDYIQTGIRKKTKTLNGNKICKKLYQEINEINASKIEKALLRIEELIPPFLTQMEFEKDKILKDKLMVKVYRERHQKNMFLKSAEKYARTLSKQKETIPVLEAKRKLYDDLYFYQYSGMGIRNVEDLAKAQYLTRRINQTIQLKYFLTTKNHKIIIDTPLANELEFEKEILIEEPLSNQALIFQKAIKIISVRTSSKLYFDFKKTFIQLQNEITDRDKFILIKIGINRAVWGSQLGERFAAKELFFWTKYGMDHKIFFLYNKLSDSEFLNITFSAFAIQNSTLQKEWMIACDQFLETEYEGKSYQIMEAYLMFSNRKYKQLIVFLNENFLKGARNPLYMTLRVKALLLLSNLAEYIEDWDKAEIYQSNVTNYIAYLKKHPQITPERFKFLKNYIKACNSIFRLREKAIDLRKDSLEIAKDNLIEKINKMLIPMMHKWLIELVKRIDNK